MIDLESANLRISLGETPGTIAPLAEAHIINFRGIGEMILELHPQVTVLFGSNAAGKTTILDAIAIGLGAISSRAPKAVGRSFAKSGDLRVPWKTRPEEGEVAGVEQPYARVTLAGPNELKWMVQRLRSAVDRAPPTKLGLSDLHTRLDPLIEACLNAPADTLTEPIPLVAAYGNERAVVAIPQRERDFQREFPRFGGLDHSLAATTRFKAVFEWFRAVEDEERRERLERKDFDFKLPALEWVRRAVERAELRCAHPRVEIKPIRMLVDFDHGDGEVEPLDINSLSDGYRTHFSLVVDIARRMVQLNPSPDLNDPVRGTNTEAVVLIDEVDLHLDPVWQGRVVQGLIAAFPRTQFILTTHSEQVIGSVDKASVRRLVAGDGEVLVEGVEFAQGATGERILVDLMNAPIRVEGPTTTALEEYLRLVGEGQGREPAVVALRAQLDEALPGDPLLHRADLDMQRRELMAQMFPGKAP